MKFKRSAKSIKQKELTEKYLSNSFRNETTKIDVSALNKKNDKNDLYNRLSQLHTNDLQYKLENERISLAEKRIIKRIISERNSR